MSFRITTLLYLFALVAASLAVLGPWGGVLATTGVALLWVAVGRSDIGIGCGLFALGWCFLIAGSFTIPVQSAREAARRNSCMGHLKQLSLSILNYESTVGTLPPATGSLGTSGDSQSWRVLLLPYCEGSQLYNAYNFNEPWNGPHNSKLPPNNYGLFECPTHGVTGTTSYLAIVGPECVWRVGPRRKLADITDRPSQTIALIDVGRSDIDWKEPRDLTFEEALQLLTSPVDPLTFTAHYSEESFFRKRAYFVNVAMLDGYVQRIRLPLDAATARGLLTTDGGENIDDGSLDTRDQAELRYDRIYGAVVLALLALLPLIPVVRVRIWPSQHVELQSD